VTERYQSGYLFSASSARGLLIGVGNVGTKLKPLHYGDTFLSRDAGLTWKQIAKGPHLYEFGNHGAIMILVAQNRNADILLYSIDDGLTWCHLSVADKDIDEVRIRDVIIEPSSTQRSFLLIGRYSSNRSVIDQSVAIYLDFSPLFPKMCNNTNHEDFESWKVSIMTNTTCHMGHSVRNRLSLPSGEGLSS
jgi:hypothetical protein